MTSFDTAVISWLQRHNLSSASPRAALVDMDGTLYDSMPRHCQAWERVASEAGLSYEPGEFYLHEGRTGAAILNILFRRTFGREATDDEVSRLYRLKTVYFSELPDVGPMPGVASVLDTFKAFGMKRILVTGSGQASLIDRLERDFLGHFSDEMNVTAGNVSRGKPDPEPFIRGMEFAGTTPRESLVLENAPLGVQAGVASGAFTVAVTTGPVPASALAGADVVFSSMQECAGAMPMLLHALKTVRLDY